MKWVLCQNVMRCISKIVDRWNYTINFTNFTLLLLKAYINHEYHNIKWQYFIFKLRAKSFLIRVLLLETQCRHLFLVITVNYIFYYIYIRTPNQCEVSIPLFYLIFSLIPVYINNMWKKSVSHKIRERIAYSGIEDSDGWVIIDKVELINEPDDRVWKVLSTCGNLAKFLLILRKKSYSKYTFVVVPSCIASAMLGRYVPGVVLLHIASMSLITWPYLTFFPFLFLNVGKYGCNKAGRYLCMKIPKCYRTFRKMISKNSDSYLAKDSENKRGISQGGLIPFFPSAWFRTQISGVGHTVPTLKPEEGMSALQVTDRPTGNGLEEEIEPGWTIDEYDELDDYIPPYDEKTAFLLEEAAEGGSTSSDSSDLGENTESDNNDLLDTRGRDTMTLDITKGSPPALFPTHKREVKNTMDRAQSVESLGSDGSDHSSNSSYIRDLLDGASILEDSAGEGVPVNRVGGGERSLKNIKLRKRPTHTQRPRDKDSPFSDMVAEGLKNVYQSLAQNFATWATDAQAVASSPNTSQQTTSRRNVHYQQTEPEDVEFYIGGCRS